MITEHGEEIWYFIREDNVINKAVHNRPPHSAFQHEIKLQEHLKPGFSPRFM